MARSRSCSVSPCTGSDAGDADKHKRGSQRPKKRPAVAKGASEASKKRKGNHDNVKDGDEPGVVSSGGVETNGTEVPASGGAAQAKAAGQPGPETDRMRAALQALRQRREDLDQAQAELAASKASEQHLQEQLQELLSHHEGKSSTASVVIQTRLSATKVELEAAQKAKASLAAEVETLQAQAAECQRVGAASAEDAKRAKIELERVHRVSEETARARDKALADAEAKAGQVEAVKAELTKTKAGQDEARAAQEKLRTELQEVSKGRAQLSVEKEAAVSALSASKAELEDMRRERSSMAELLGNARASLAEAVQAKEDLSREVQVVRAQLSAARSSAQEDLQSLRTQLESGNGVALHASACAELEAAWEALVSTGLEQMRKALTTAGVRASPVVAPLSLASATRTLSASSAEGSSSMRSRHHAAAPAPLGLQEEASGVGRATSSGSSAAEVRHTLRRRRSSAKLEDDSDERDEPGRKKDRNEKREKNEKKEKKRDKKERKEKRVESDRSEEDQEIQGHTVVRETAPKAALAKSASDIVNLVQHEDNSDMELGTSGGSAKANTVFAHRVYLPGRSALKRKRGEPRRAPPRLKFAGSDGQPRQLVSKTNVVSYRHLTEELWFTNPQANVLCEQCKRRVPQKMGQLRGGSGGSSFMCHEFICGECVEGG